MTMPIFQSRIGVTASFSLSPEIENDCLFLYNMIRDIPRFFRFNSCIFVHHLVHSNSFHKNQTLINKKKKKTTSLPSTIMETMKNTSEGQ